MAIPTCPKCGGTAFAASRLKIRNWEDDVVFFHCDTCGAIVGGTYVETDDMLDALMQDVIPPMPQKG